MATASAETPRPPPDTDIEAAPAYGLSLDFAPYPSDMKFELFWSRQDTGLDLNGSGGHVDMSVDEFLIGGVYELGQGRLRETVSALVGASAFSPDGAEREARFSFGIGPGVKYFLLKNLALRAELRGYGTVVEADSVFISSGGNTVAYFSGSAIWQGEVSGGITLLSNTPESRIALPLPGRESGQASEQNQG
jgi:hypothetical protein